MTIDGCAYTDYSYLTKEILYAITKNHFSSAIEWEVIMRDPITYLDETI